MTRRFVRTNRKPDRDGFVPQCLSGESVAALAKGHEAMAERIAALEREVVALKRGMFAALDVLNPLSMGTEGHLRGRVCTASNALDGALGRTQSSHGEKYEVQDT